MFNIFCIIRRTFFVCPISVSVLRPLQHTNGIRNFGFELTSEASYDNVHFLKSFPRLVSDLTANDDDGLNIFFQHFTKVIDSNVPYGIMIHGLTAINTYKALHPNPQQISEEEMFLVNMMAWPFEILRSFFNLLDDIIDNSEVRYGRACWHKNKDIGLYAVADGVMIYTKLFDLLKKYFRDKPYYLSFVEIMHNVCMEVHMGQLFDIRMSIKFRQTRSFDDFTWKNQARMTNLKTTGPMYAPIAVPMLMHGLSDPEAFSQAKFVSALLAQLYTDWDDYLDVFGDISELGKSKMDATQGKCSWPMLTALEYCSSEQRQILKDNYGKSDNECVQRVSNVFYELRLDDLYRKHAKGLSQHIVNVITAPTFKLPPSIFTYCLDFFIKK